MTQIYIHRVSKLDIQQRQDNDHFGQPYKTLHLNITDEDNHEHQIILFLSAAGIELNNLPSTLTPNEPLTDDLNETII